MEKPTQNELKHAFKNGKYYEAGDEKLIVEPWACFFVSRSDASEHYFVIVSPKYDMDLDKYKISKNPPAKTIKTILLKIARAVIYLNMVRRVTQQDIKPTNVLVSGTGSNFIINYNLQ